MRLTIFALILFFPLTAFAGEVLRLPIEEEQKSWTLPVFNYLPEIQQVSKESDKQLKSIRKSLKDLERALERRRTRQQQIPRGLKYPTKK